ncbi:MAG: serine/threonine protein kinase [Planctomycetota bacterium]
MGLLEKLQALFKRKEKLDVAKRFGVMREAITGTMSQFYMARDHESGKVVGLKLLDRDKTMQFEARFKGLKKQSEGEIATQIKHPRLVETYEFGETTSGQPFLVMEFCKGVNLSTLIVNKDPVFLGRRANMIRQMAEALDAVHKAGFIHRDVCPRNFIYNAEEDAVKMIDFGLTVPATKEFMQPGNRTGTPMYMAPEVVRRRPTDQRLDIFAFGVTAYQLLTFNCPWPVTDTTGMGAMSHDQAPRDLLEYRPELNKELAAAVMRCVAPNADKRFASMSVFLRAIRKVAGEEEPAAA